MLLSVCGSRWVLVVNPLARERSSRELARTSAFTRKLTRRRALGRSCSNGTSLMGRILRSESTAKGGIFSCETSFSHSPDTKYRDASVPPDTCTPYWFRYPVAFGDDMGSLNRL